MTLKKVLEALAILLCLTLSVPISVALRFHLIEIQLQEIFIHMIDFYRKMDEK